MGWDKRHTSAMCKSVMVFASSVVAFCLGGWSACQVQRRSAFMTVLKSPPSICNSSVERKTHDERSRNKALPSELTAYMLVRAISLDTMVKWIVNLRPSWSLSTKRIVWQSLVKKNNHSRFTSYRWGTKDLTHPEFPNAIKITFSQMGLLENGYVCP